MEVISIERSIYEELLTSFFVLCSTFRNLALPARSYCNSEMKRKASFSFAFHSFFRNFAIKMANLLRLDKKRNKFLCFVLDFS